MKILQAKALFFSLFFCLLLTSCFEVIEDVTLKNDGSGTCKYLLNASQSRIKLNGLLVADSLAKHKLPSKSEVQERIRLSVNELKKQKGISAVVFKSNWSDYIFELSFDFSSVKELNEALYALQKLNTQNQKGNYLVKEPFAFDGLVFKRLKSYELPTEEKARLDYELSKNIDMLGRARFISILRFEREISNMTHAGYKLSSTGKAVMMQTSIHKLFQDTYLENTITLKK